ncbi:threonine aldolase family protein [Oceanithermus profundus]
MRILDFRSDTVTRPSPAMRRAMAEAEVGDDVYREDPTVNRLEALAAEMLGFERAVYMPSGTMTNQVALLVHTRRGQEVILTEGAHVYEFEPGAMANLSGASPRFVPSPYGVPDPEEVRRAVHTSPHQAPTGLIALENTHNTAGGTVVPLEVQRAVQAVAREAGLPVHLDGARLFNAAVALGVEGREVAAGFDTVSICLSKGLGAPVGSLLLGPAELEGEIRRYRKMLGGGMRQAGVLAAAGLIALTEGPKALARDHALARELAEGLVRLGLDVDLKSVQTNMVFARVEDAPGFAARLREAGVLINALGPERVRFVAHRDLPDEAAAEALARIAPLLG